MAHNEYFEQIPGLAQRCVNDEKVKIYLTPARILWKSETKEAAVENAQELLKNREAQISLAQKSPCLMRNAGGHAGILLDFGFELSGGIQISSWRCGKGAESAKVRIRFGESAAETMSEPGEKYTDNYHSVRDMTVELQYLGTTETGNTGFRFVRIDLLEDDCTLELKTIKAAFTYRDLDYKGSFRCSDALLNKIWLTGAYTVQLNMQDYLWDGIKRDRLVWIGDMHPETSTIGTVFGYDDVVPRSLDFIRDETPLPGWMNGIPSYSMWWILIHHDWFMHTGDLKYLREQEPYLCALLNQLTGYIGADGKDNTPEPRFIDWPTSENKKATGAGLQALHILADRAALGLFRALGNETYCRICEENLEKMGRYIPDHDNCKQEAALMVLAGLADAQKTNRDLLSHGGAQGIGAFTGFYLLKARALAGDICGCLDNIREYWGGMLSLGATTFWEDFDVTWLENASRIDELPKEGKKDAHGDYGLFCYVGFRKSLCHGWASGPTPWLTENILGIRVTEPGCKTVRITPRLGNLSWAEGTFPTPFGTISVRHKKKPDGSISSRISAPPEIKIIR